MEQERGTSRKGNGNAVEVPTYAAGLTAAACPPN
jgi:hypothetical protein